MTPDELADRAQQEGSIDLSGPEEIEDPCKTTWWVGVLTVLVMIGCVWIGLMVVEGIVREYVSIQAHLRPNP